MKPPSSPRAAFSLPELMVALLIVAILSLLGFGVMRSSRESTKNSKCISNLRMCGIALLSHAADHSGRSLTAFMPLNAKGYENDPQKGYLWHQQLKRKQYLPDLAPVVCPSFPPYQWSDNTPMRAYGLRRQPSPYFNEPAFILQKIAHPSRHIILADSSKVGAWVGQQYYLEIMYSAADKIHARHHSKANIFFADGSVRALSREEIVDLNDGWVSSHVDLTDYQLP